MSGAIIAGAGAASGIRPQITNTTVGAVTNTPTHATASYTLSSTGDITRVNHTGSADIGDWLASKVGMSAYECRMTTTSGTLTTGTVGSWLSLGTSRTWGKTTAGIANASYVGTLEIRQIGSSITLTSATITLNVEESA